MLFVTKARYDRDIEALRQDVERATRWRKEDHESKNQVWQFLSDILILDPSLKRFRIDGTDWEPGSWDFAGVRKAVKLMKAQKKLAKYQAKAATK